MNCAPWGRSEADWVMVNTRRTYNGQTITSGVGLSAGGGGLFVGGKANPLFKNSTFAYNIAGGYGGAGRHQPGGRGMGPGGHIPSDEVLLYVGQ